MTTLPPPWACPHGPRTSDSARKLRNTRVLSSPRIGIIMSAGDDRTLRIWTAAGEPVALLPIEGHGQLLTTGPDGGLIACGDSGGFTYMARLRRTTTSQPVERQLNHA